MKLIVCPPYKYLRVSTSPQMSSTPSPSLRRSVRLAAKPQPTYTEHVEEIDDDEEATHQQVNDMFDVLLEESYENAKTIRHLHHVFRSCCRKFREMFADLPKDNLQRRIADAIVDENKTLLRETGSYIPYFQSYNYELYNKAYKRICNSEEYLAEKALRENRKTLIAKEIQPYIELAIEFKKLKSKLEAAMKTSRNALLGLRLSNRQERIERYRPRKDAIKILLNSIKLCDERYTGSALSIYKSLRFARISWL